MVFFFCNFTPVFIFKSYYLIISQSSQLHHDTSVTDAATPPVVYLTR